MNVATRKRTVYHISPLRLWLVPGMLIIIALFFLALPYIEPKPDAPDSGNLIIYMGIFFFVFAGVMYLIMRYTRLELSADGIKLYQFGYKLETDWDNVAHLYDESGVEGLVLHRPMDCQGARTLNNFRNTKIKGVQFYSSEQIQLLVEHRLIPIEAFAYWLKKGQLRDDLIRRAPALGNG
jgi:hypothetical protein